MTIPDGAANGRAKAPLWENDEARRVLDTMAELFVALDREYRIVFINQALRSLIGERAYTLVGQCHWDLWPEMRGTVVEHAYERAFKTGIPERFEYRYEPRDVWIEVNAYLVEDHLHVYFRDITREKQANQSMRGVIDAVPHIAWVTEADGRMAYINAKWAEFTGVDGMDAEAIRNAIHPEDLPTVVQMMRRSRELGVSQAYDLRLLSKHGEYRWHRVKASPVRAANGEIERWIGTSTDVHDEVVAYAALKEIEDHHRFRIESSPQVPWLAGPDGVIYDFGGQWLELTGMTLEEAAESQMTVLHPDDMVRMADTWSRRLESGDPLDLEHRISARGEYRWVRTRATARRDAQGQIVRWYGMTEDIHDRKVGEARLEQMQASLNLALKASRMGWWTRNLLTEEVQWSPELEELFGIPAGAFNGTEADFLDFVHAEDVGRVVAAVQSAVQNGTDYSVEFRFTRKDGAERWMDGRGRASYDELGKAIWIYGIGIDITDRKLTQQQEAVRLEHLVAARTMELESAYREQESFSYSVSHDLRSPLRSIVATARILEQDFGELLPQDARNLLNKQASSANKLATLIDDLLQLSRVGRLELVMKTVDLTELFEGAVNALHNHNEAVFEIAPDLTCTGDEQLLRLVAQNLVENAAKFSPEGGTVTVGAENGAFFIADQGVGFPMAYVHKLFQPFQRLHRENEFEGTGIGLATVRRIIERHRGRVWAESETGQGATFWFTIG
jgi:PAS domain S-box-containing protein